MQPQLPRLMLLRLLPQLLTLRPRPTLLKSLLSLVTLLSPLLWK